MHVPDGRPVRGGIAVLFALAIAYCIAALGIPLGPAGTVGVAAAVVGAVVFRGAPLPSRVFSAAAAALVAVIVVRVAIGLALPPAGWLARYYDNETWSGEPRWSADYRLPGATRIDARIAFRDDAFPAHYLNDYDFTDGTRREVSEPMSIEWTGHVTAGLDRIETVSLTARGRATVDLDGRQVLSVAGTTTPAHEQAAVPLAAGPHTIVVRYAKPGGTDGLIELSFPLVTSPEPGGRAEPGSFAPGALRLCNVLVLVIATAMSFYAGLLLWRAGQLTRRQTVPLALAALFGVQGWWRASPLAHRMVSLTAGDDWWGFESCARDVLQHGLLMPLGKPLGEGAPYFYHPFYCYFLAGVHGVTGESLFGPVFLQFLVLAAVAVAVWRLVADQFGETPALAGLAALLVVMELDFTRYYTVTLLSENLYVLTVTLTLVPFVRWMRSGEQRWLVRAAFWGGVSSITRPAMMVFFVPALALVAVGAAARTRRVRPAAIAVALTAAVWLGVIAPVTLRNWIVSGEFVLISQNLGNASLVYNVPPVANAAEYLAKYDGSATSAVKVIADAAWHHPVDFVRMHAKKFGFSIGMVHWFDGYRPHPELIGVTLLYCAMLALSRRIRAREFWPVHLFVVTHVASMGLTAPWNYGYRLILPPFVYTSSLSVGAASALVLARGLRPTLRHAARSAA